MDMKKTISLVLLLIVLVSTFVGCGPKAVVKEDDSGSTVQKTTQKQATQDQNKLDPVTLKLMMPGQRPVAMDEVLAEAEKRMADTVNAKIELIYATWEDYAQKSQVTLSAGEDMDLIFDAPWNHMQEMIGAGYYEPLEELLDKYGPEIKSTRPKEMWDANKFQGKDGVFRIYGIPLGNAHFLGKSYIIRTDIREKIGIPPIKTWDDFIKFLYAVKEKEKNIIPIIPSRTAGAFAEFKMYMDQETNIRPLVAGLYGPLYLRNNDGKVYNMFEEMEPKYWDAVREARKLYNDGIIYADVMAVNNYQEELKNGKTASTSSNAFGNATGLNHDPAKVIPDAKFENVILIDPNKQMISDFKQWNFQCVPMVSKKKERAIMFLNWANQKENYDLLSYGIKGEHWEPVGDNKIENLLNPEHTYEQVPYLWTWNPVHDRLYSDYPEDVVKMELWLKDAKNFIPDKISGFTFNTAPVNSEVSQYNNLRDTYWYVIANGTVDPDETWAEYKEKCAPYAKRIQEEMQKQIDQYLADRGK